MAEKQAGENQIPQGILKNEGKSDVVNLVQNEKMKISTIDESEKNGEKSLHCPVERVKILT